MDEVQRQELIEAIVQVVRQSHDVLALHMDNPGSEMTTLEWIGEHADELAAVLYRLMPHWHSAEGKCAERTPFEVWVGAVGLFGAVWFYEIMLRKSRDRGSLHTRVMMGEWRELLFNALNAARAQVDGTRDERAEQEFEEAHRPARRLFARLRLRHWFNRIRWGH